MHRFTCVVLFSSLTLQIALSEDPSHLASVSAKPLEVFDSLNSAAPSTPGAAQTDTQAIYALLLKMVDRWNAHDIDGYVAAFWNSPDLWCVVGANTFFGYAELCWVSRYCGEQLIQSPGSFSSRRREETALVSPAAAAIVPLTRIYGATVSPR